MVPSRSPLLVGGHREGGHWWWSHRGDHCWCSRLFSIGKNLGSRICGMSPLSLHPFPSLRFPSLPFPSQDDLLVPKPPQNHPNPLQNPSQIHPKIHPKSKPRKNRKIMNKSRSSKCENTPIHRKSHQKSMFGEQEIDMKSTPQNSKRRLSERVGTWRRFSLFSCSF